MLASADPHPRTRHGLSAERWYAQALADALYRNRMTPLRFRVDGETPNFRAVGGSQTSFPGIFHTNAQAVPKAGVRAAHLALGRHEYDVVLAHLRATRPAWNEAWWEWLEPQFDQYGRLKPATALFQARGGYVQPGACSEGAQLAAVAIVRAATITLHTASE